MFVAIDLPPSIRQTLVTVQDQFRSLALKASWVRPDNIHLTLKFLGDVEAGRLPEIQQALKEAVQDIERFALVLTGLGVFPPRGAPRVLWAGLEESSGYLSRVHGKIEDGLAGLGFPREERAFRPHLTLARIKNPKGAGALRTAVENAGPLPRQSFQVDSVVLFQSQLTPKGSIYTVLNQTPLVPGSSAGSA